jgi:hypothetical protein
MKISAISRARWIRAWQRRRAPGSRGGRRSIRDVQDHDSCDVGQRRMTSCEEIAALLD